MHADSGATRNQDDLPQATLIGGYYLATSWGLDFMLEYPSWGPFRGMPYGRSRVSGREVPSRLYRGTPPDSHATVSPASAAVART